MIDRETGFAQQGLKAAITIKLNNLEEKLLINKLYEASNAGVTINLIIRGICRIIPGVKGMSENITVRRIVDRYLEHGRLFWFHNNGQEEMYAGSADWMNRNIYRRIEVCFPIYDEAIKKELQDIITIQLKDTVAAVTITEQSNDAIVATPEEKIRSQEIIYQMLKRHE
jgi:polyphosphate kinase